MNAVPALSTAAPAPGAVPEAELVAAAREGDEPAVRELIRRLNPRLFRIARGIVASDAEAEEVVQDSYLAAFTRLAEFENRARFSTWITRITINNARMLARRARPQEGYDTVTETESPQILAFPGRNAETAEGSLGRSQIRHLLETAIAELPPELRLPFLLHETEGLKLREIAEDLSLNPITVKTRLFRARRRLRRALESRIDGGFESVFPFDGARCATMADRVVAELKKRSGP
ncbi:RNA polymerase sigma factor [Frigidibacter sp. ROC022]|uniref:RNA polymerase sigma factor n=1 Tax=Frigidibacter sp. ROC022 TaxID=2971796 RepID=UPI00215AE2B0|nr:RNA polymerase sigma factor [Frigidibacter sp. ROC022]MCR8725548.1 RNA polymerase sigma factor [Frigidibacter sp. ROC022]